MLALNDGLSKLRLHALLAVGRIDRDGDVRIDIREPNHPYKIYLGRNRPARFAEFAKCVAGPIRVVDTDTDPELMLLQLF